MKAWTFQLPKGTGKKSVDIGSVTIREVNGEDEELAAAQTEAKGAKGKFAVELLRLSIVKVNGRAVEHPFGDFDRWNSRTRKFVLDAWTSINSVDESESEDFLTGARLEEDEGASIVAISSERG